MRRIGLALQGIGAALLAAMALAASAAAWAYLSQAAVGLFAGAAVAAAGVYAVPLSLMLIVAGWIVARLPGEETAE